jgi:hypothetical protein
MEETMDEVKEPVIAAQLKAPRAGAIAGILFSILLIISVVLLRLCVMILQHCRAYLFQIWSVFHRNRLLPRRSGSQLELVCQNAVSGVRSTPPGRGALPAKQARLWRQHADLLYLRRQRFLGRRFGTILKALCGFSLADW